MTRLIARLAIFVMIMAVLSIACTESEETQPPSSPEPEASPSPKVTYAPTTSATEPLDPDDMPEILPPTPLPNDSKPGTVAKIIAIGEEQYFALKIGEQIMGYNTYKVLEKKQHQDKDVFVIEGHTLLKVNLPAGEQVMDYSSVTYFHNDLTPAYYRMDFTDGNQEQQVEVKFTNSIAHLTAQAAGQTIEQSIDLPAGTLIADGNIFDHYVFLFRALDLHPGQTVTVPLLIPQTMSVMEVEIIVSDKLEVELKIEGLPSQHFQLSDAGELLGMTLPSQNFTMEPSDAGVVTRVRGIDMSKLLENKFADSNVQFSFMTNVSYMKAMIEVAVAGEEVNIDSLSTDRQSFRGTVDDNLIKGTVENEAVKYDGQNAPPFPMEASAELAPYLKPEVKIESDDPLILEKAKEITRESRDTWEAARAISDWVYRNIRYELTASGAKQALVDRKGDCGPHALLAIAMSRSVGIPARLAGGFAYANGQFGQHYWVEHHMGDAGWIPSDPTVGEYGWIDATHVRLFENAAIEHLISVEVIDYVDQAEGATAERSGLQLSVGQKHRYAFLEEGSEFGFHEYEVTAEEEQDGVNVYTIEATLELDSSKTCAPTTATASLRLDERGSPLSYESEASIGSG